MTSDTPQDLEAELRDLFTGKVSLDVDVPPGTVAHVLARTRRARRRTTSVRAVTAVAALGAAGTVATVADDLDRPATVSPARVFDPRCQEYWSPPTPSPGDTEVLEFGYPVWEGATEPPILVDPSATDNPLPGMTEIPRPMRGPHGGVLCTVVDGRAEVVSDNGLGWPTELPVTPYTMLPGATPGTWNTPGPVPSELRRTSWPSQTQLPTTPPPEPTP
jgi:hypothetical protein